MKCTHTYRYTHRQSDTHAHTQAHRHTTQRHTYTTHRHIDTSYTDIQTHDTHTQMLVQTYTWTYRHTTCRRYTQTHIPNRHKDAGRSAVWPWVPAATVTEAVAAAHQAHHCRVPCPLWMRPPHPQGRQLLGHCSLCHGVCY